MSGGEFVAWVLIGALVGFGGLMRWFRRKPRAIVTEHYDPDTGSMGFTIAFPDGGGPKGFDPATAETIGGGPDELFTVAIDARDNFLVIRRDPTPEA